MTHHTNTLRIARHARVLLILLAVALVATVGRVGQLKLDPRSELQFNQGAREARTFEPRYRGAVYDRTGRTLAIDRPAWRLAIDPSFFFKHGYKRLDRTTKGKSHPLDPTAGLFFDDELADLIGPLAMTREHLRVVRFNQLGRSLGASIGIPGHEITMALLAAPPTRRYLVLDRLLEDWQVEMVRSWIDNRELGVMLEQRTIRAYFGPKSLRMIVGKVRDNGQGGSGLEQNRNEELKSSTGILHTRRTSRGEVISVPRGSYEPGEDGRDFILTIDAHIQSIVEARLREQLNSFNAGGGRCIVIDPFNGDILAMVDILRRRPDWDEVILDDPLRRLEPSLARNRNLIDAFEPGSTFKPFMWSGSVQAGVGSTRPLPRNAQGKINVNLHEVSIKGRRATVKDAGNNPYHGPLDDIETILIRSLNTGMIEMVRPLSHVEARAIPIGFGFGKRTDCGIAGAAEHPGQVTSLQNWSYANTSVSVSFGHEIAVTTPQMTRAFSAFCTGGLMPQLRIAMPHPDEGIELALDASPLLMTRAIAPAIALRTKNALRRVVTEGTLRRHARSEKYSMFGKSGTADLPNPEGGYFKDRHIANVIAAAPFDHPRLVVYCVIDDPDKSIGHYGGMVAGPVVRDVIDKTLYYKGIKPDLVDQSIDGNQLFASASEMPAQLAGD